MKLSELKELCESNSPSTLIKAICVTQVILELIERIEGLSEALNDLTPCYCETDLGECVTCREKSFVLSQFGSDAEIK